MTQLSKKQVHISLQGKGGVGKSIAASFIAQLYTERGGPVLFLDTDPMNQTFLSYKGLNVEAVNVLTPDGQAINQRAFDTLVERIAASPTETVAVIDTGSGNFVDLCSYMLVHGLVPFLQEQCGCEVYFHISIAGGASYTETMVGLGDLLDQFTGPKTGPKIVVWLNEYFGPAVSQDGNSFEASGLVKKQGDRIAGIIPLIKRHAQTFEADMKAMISARQTFAEALQDPNINIMAKQRLTTVWRETRAAMEAVLPLPSSPQPHPKDTNVKDIAVKDAAVEGASNG